MADWQSVGRVRRSRSSGKTIFDLQTERTESRKRGPAAVEVCRSREGEEHKPDFLSCLSRPSIGFFHLSFHIHQSRQEGTANF